MSHGGLKDLDCSGNGLGDNGAAEVVEVRGPFLWEEEGQVRWQSARLFVCYKVGPKPRS